jgi:hypothetical protein
MLKVTREIIFRDKSALPFHWGARMHLILGSIIVLIILTHLKVHILFLNNGDLWLHMIIRANFLDHFRHPTDPSIV